jgi:hypothetical protein
VDGVRAGIVVEIGIIDVVEKDSTARVGVGIINNVVGVVEEEGGIERACAIEKE